MQVPISFISLIQAKCSCERLRTMVLCSKQHDSHVAPCVCNLTSPFPSSLTPLFKSIFPAKNTRQIPRPFFQFPHLPSCLYSQSLPTIHIPTLFFFVFPSFSTSQYFFYSPRPIIPSLFHHFCSNSPKSLLSNARYSHSPLFQHLFTLQSTLPRVFSKNFSFCFVRVL